MTISSARKYIGIFEHNPFFLRGLMWWISTNRAYRVTIADSTTDDFRQSLNAATRYRPEIILLGLNGPILEMRNTIKWIKEHHKNIKVLGIVMQHLEEDAVVKAFQAGLDGFITPYTEPEQLFRAFSEVSDKGTYCPEQIAKILKDWLAGPTAGLEGVRAHLTDKQEQFLQMMCKDLSYEQMSEKLQVAIKTVGNYRKYFFKLFNVRSRAGLMLQLIKHEWVKFK